MPARVQTDGLVVTFCHADEDDQEALATKSKHAREIARRMLAKCVTAICFRSRAAGPRRSLTQRL